MIEKHSIVNIRPDNSDAIAVRMTRAEWSGDLLVDRRDEPVLVVAEPIDPGPVSCSGNLILIKVPISGELKPSNV